MVAARIRYVAISVLAGLYFSAIGCAAVLDRDFGNLDVRVVSIPDRDYQLSGLLYRPVGATAESPKPGVVLVHGLSGAKQMMSGIALELGRHGFVALAVDLVGHGNSEGVFGLVERADPALGVLSAVRYLESQSFVDNSSVSLVGHSLGAGAIRAAAAAHGDIIASAFIAGGFGLTAVGPSYGVLNLSFPRNLLVAVGRHDVLFDLDHLTELYPAFGTEDIAPNRLYGDFSASTARKLITPATTHVFEPIDPSIVSEIVLWMSNAVESESQNLLTPIYVYREAAISVGLFALVALILPVSLVVFDFFSRAAEGRRSMKEYGTLEDWKSMGIWGLLGIILFIPTFIFRFLIPVPPFSVLGSSLASWLSGVGVSGLVLIRFLLPRISAVKLGLKSAISKSFDLYQTLGVAVLFILLYLIAYITETMSLIDIRIFVIPVFNDLRPVARVLAFFLLMPFFLVYFFAEGLYLHELHAWPDRGKQFRREILAMSKAIALKIAPYVLVICIQYVPMFLLDLRPFPGFTGFIVEFFWGFVPTFIITTTCSWWLYRCTSKVGPGAIFNALLFAWSAAAIFPLGPLAGELYY